MTFNKFSKSLLNKFQQVQFHHGLELKRQNVELMWNQYRSEMLPDWSGCYRFARSLAFWNVVFAKAGTSSQSVGDSNHVRFGNSSASIARWILSIIAALFMKNKIIEWKINIYLEFKLRNNFWGNLVKSESGH